ncbi:TIGR03758 family integrating conjugative element protein [Salmonella enterica]|uniref:TIGR03758 family integrating conjugative element protein n=1 Tax=Salmonella enterica TaxID=28901 RepID=A0A5U7AQR0_SALER|nr:TIGR03758 family integrating conjugative element protein [Salmonella enterica]EAW2140328.1 TIGR03758 family integrating conjugative element protein [Salmonella enterica subsp. enterica]ECW3055648.1 TIGR03758 family integrating conjugative element protein [Salmonella enterica subsp. enterica serovar Sandiego]EDB4489406.1 TIGR03758 family integrating conjugative element protein [Salmonella enterica subsp. enterica serovar Rubislaw]EDD5420553.1 TIGR03758 family integrating conjugative element p
MNQAQITAFSTGAGGIAPSAIKLLVVAIFFAFLFLWVAWALRTVYVGWSNQDVRGEAVGIFVIRAVILLELAILFFSY